MKTSTHKPQTSSSNIDLLYQHAASYRDSREFKELLDFCARFRTLSPYNAMLVQMQMPTAEYVLTAAEWKRKHNRILFPHARPILVLVPFGPVEYVFDLSETTHDPNEPKDLFEDMEFMDAVKAAQLTAERVPDEGTLNLLRENLNGYGIAVNETDALPEGRHAELVPDRSLKVSVATDAKKRRRVECDSRFALHLDTQSPNEVRFAAVCHELGRLFCHHTGPAGERWWKPRNAEPEIEEFEAQTVTWLVCRRRNLANPDADYLERYFSHTATIPEISMDRILAATNEIEKMLAPMHFKRGYLFKYDADFKALLQQTKKPLPALTEEAAELMTEA